MFLQQCPIFERLLVADGIHLTKYWFSVSDREQERRLEARIDDPMRRWKLSATDLDSRTHLVKEPTETDGNRRYSCDTRRRP